MDDQRVGGRSISASKHTASAVDALFDNFDLDLFFLRIPALDVVVPLDVVTIVIIGPVPVPAKLVEADLYTVPDTATAAAVAVAASVTEVEGEESFD